VGLTGVALDTPRQRKIKEHNIQNHRLIASKEVKCVITKETPPLTHPPQPTPHPQPPVTDPPCDSPKLSITSTGSTSKGEAQYSANMHATVLSTTLALVRSVAVHSMRTSRVLRLIWVGWGGVGWGLGLGLGGGE